MKIVNLDGCTTNPGDLSWEGIEKLGDYTVYDRTSPDKIIERAKGANSLIVNKTVITREYPATWKKGDEPYYPINNEKNNLTFEKYNKLAKKEKNVIFGGRLAEYKYYDMHNVIERALLCVENEFNNKK